MLPPDGGANVRAIVDGAEDVHLDAAAEVTRLAAMPKLDYERERKQAAERLGARISALDDLVKSARAQADRASADTTGGGRPLQIADVEPWPCAVDGAGLLDDLAQMIRRHVVLDQAAADATALWIAHTHAIDAAYVTPRLAITSPEKRCGKTTLLSVLCPVVARPLSAANITPATVFRAIDAVRPCLLVDEADTFFGQAEELRGIINAGHCRATATVLRTVDTPEGFEVREFSVWGPVAIAAIGKLPGTIEDRSVKIALRRRRPDEAVERVRLDRLDELKPLARRAARWIADNFEVLRRADPDVPDELHDRAADNWRPLLAIADVAGGDWPERARRAALVLTKEGTQDADTARTLLLTDLRQLFAAAPSGILFSAEILKALHDRDDRPWPEYRRGKPITAPQLAALLRPLQISSGTVRRGEVNNKGYKIAQFTDAWARYLPASASVTPSQPFHSAAATANSSVTHGVSVTDRQWTKAAETVACDVVTAPAPDATWKGNLTPFSPGRWQPASHPIDRDDERDVVPAFEEAEIE
jgi:hypothetical protein